MRVDHIEILVEEPSMEAALRVLIPRIAGNISFAIHPFHCKTALLEQLPRRLRGYAKWLPPTHRIIVVVDRDDDNCTTLKQRLEQIAQRAGIVTRAHKRSSRYQLANRIAIEELEAWFFGDWDAVCAAYPRVERTISGQKPFRDPDAIAGGTWEALERLLQKAGYFSTGLRKLEAARAIANHMVPERNRSHSFKVFCTVLREMVA